MVKVHKMIKMRRRREQRKKKTILKISLAIISKTDLI